MPHHGLHDSPTAQPSPAQAVPPHPVPPTVVDQLRETLRATCTHSRHDDDSRLSGGGSPSSMVMAVASVGHVDDQLACRRVLAREDAER